MDRAKRINKKHFKHIFGKCQLCGEDNYAVLDVHRLIPQGKYSMNNSVCLCVLCHRKVHAGQIKLDRWFPSTNGWVLRVLLDNGEDKFI